MHADEDRHHSQSWEFSSRKKTKNGSASETHLFVNDTTEVASTVFWKLGERAHFCLLDRQGEAPTNGMSNHDH
jgi:hypothetical protein